MFFSIWKKIGTVSYLKVLDLQQYVRANKAGFFILKKWELTALPSFKRYSELIRNDLVFENIAPISFRFDLKREWGKILPCRQDLIDLKSLVLNCHQEKWMHDGDKEWHFTQQRYAHNTIKQYTLGGVKKTMPCSRVASIM